MPSEVRVGNDGKGGQIGKEVVELAAEEGEVAVPGAAAVLVVVAMVEEVQQI